MSEPEEFDCLELHSCIKEVAKIKGIDDFEYHVDYIYGKGDNYIANIFRVLVKRTGCDNDNVSVIVKTLVNTTRQVLFNELHKREVTAYSNVMPKYKQIQSELKELDRVILPECLFSCTDKGNEIIILEDLLINGFEMDDKLSKHENLSYDQVSLVIAELAKFHGLSFAFENKHADTFIKLKEDFKDIIFQDSFLNKSKLRTYFADSFNMSVNVVTDPNAKKKLQRVEQKLLQIMRTYLQPRKYNVLCHGDCWINNVLFKYEENKQPQLCFVDYQAMRYASPVTDIISFLFICTDSVFRLQHFKDLQNIYYESLKSFLNLYNIDVANIYPRTEFESDIEDYLPYGLLLALLELRIVTTTPEDDAIMKGSNIVPGSDTSVVPGEINLFKIRVDDVVQEAVESGTLDKIVTIING